MKLTPSFLVTFETDITGVATHNWERVAQSLIWDRLMKQRPAKTKHEIVTWLLDTSGFYPAGNGGNARFDAILAWQTEIDNQHVNKALKLTTDEIEDNVLKDNPTVGVLDYATKWASDTGFQAAYWPQQAMFALILQGTTATGYDGVPFFSANHPIAPGQTPNQGTYSNLISGVPIDNTPTTGQTEFDALILSQLNFANALAVVGNAKFAGGVPRHLRVSAVLVPPQLQYRAEQIVGAAVLNAGTNVIANRNIEVIVAPELSGEASNYYLVVDDMMSDELGALIYSERAPFAIRTYSPVDEATLDLRDEWIWLAKGRNGTQYGHPYLLYKCTP